MRGEKLSIAWFMRIRDVRGGLFFCGAGRGGVGRGKGENPSFLPMKAFEGKNGPFGTPVGA